MAAADSLLSEDQFLCSICLDVFTDPLSTPCGHNFCKSCITEHWDINVRCDCPICKKIFYPRPELQVNTFISEMAAQFRHSAQQRASSSSSSEQQAAKPGEVPCDVCTGTKLKALKSCLVCLVSYCETHLEPHLTASGLKRHQLIDPVENLEGRMCAEHNKLLELFCKDDQASVCMLCSILNHKAHEVVPLKEEYEIKKAELAKTEAELQQMIRERREKIQELNDSVKVSRRNADREIAYGVPIFTRIKDATERKEAEMTKMIEEEHRMMEEQVHSFISRLEQEVSVLKKRSAELEQLSHSEHHLNFLQKFSSLNDAPPTTDWTKLKARPPSYRGDVRTAVDELVNEINRMFPVPELKTVQQFAVDVTLDPDTANPELIVSDDGKQVHHGPVKRNLPDNPQRFSTGLCVLGKQIYSSGRFYFEVQVKGKTQWEIGVANESINRKGPLTINLTNGYWALCMKNENEYCASFDAPLRLSLTSKPEKLGVFVDYEKGLISFYDADAAHPIFSLLGCCFTEKLFPFLCTSFNLDGKNSAPLIICPVNPTE